MRGTPAKKQNSPTSHANEKRVRTMIALRHGILHPMDRIGVIFASLADRYNTEWARGRDNEMLGVRYLNTYSKSNVRKPTLGAVKSFTIANDGASGPNLSPCTIVNPNYLYSPHQIEEL